MNVKCNNEECGYCGPMKSKAISQEVCPKCFKQGTLKWTRDAPKQIKSYLEIQDQLKNMRR